MDQVTLDETAFVKSLGISANEEKPEDFSWQGSLQGRAPKRHAGFKTRNGTGKVSLPNGRDSNVRQLDFWDA